MIQALLLTLPLLADLPPLEDSTPPPSPPPTEHISLTPTPWYDPYYTLLQKSQEVINIRKDGLDLTLAQEF